MAFLVKAGGEIYIPCDECSAGNAHYDFENVDDVVIGINPKRPALRYLRKLLGKMKNMGEEGFSTERTNLLYEKEGDELDLDINGLTGRPKTFDFFVQERFSPKLERFQYCGDGKKSERISFKGKPLGKKQRACDIFGNVEVLELAYVGSPEAELTAKDDYQVVNDWAEREDKNAGEELLKRLGRYCQEKVGSLGVMDLLVLLAASSAQKPESLYASEIADTAMEIAQEVNYWCPCMYEEEFAEENIQVRLENLAEKGLLQEVDDRFVILPEYRIGQFEEAIFEEYSGLDYVARNDLVSAAALLSLSEGPTGLEDILAKIKEYGLEAGHMALSRRLKGLAEEGIVMESDGMFQVNPAYISRYNPDQISFAFKTNS